MAKTGTTSIRAPRGTKVVAEAFFTALNEIPEPQRADVVKAALALIRDRLKDARGKAKLAKGKQKAKGAKAPAPSRTAGDPKAARKQTTVPAKAKQAGATAAVKRRKAPQMKASEPEPTPSGDTATPNEGVTR
jgi:hypothetical protein